MEWIKITYMHNRYSRFFDVCKHNSLDWTNHGHVCARAA